MAKSPKLKKLPRTKLANRSQTQEELTLRREKVYEMRAVYRMSFREIAEKLGVSLSVVHDDAKFITRLKTEGMIERDTAMAAEINHLYDAALKRWVPFMLSDEFVVEDIKLDRKGEPKTIRLPAWEAAGVATDKITKILEQKAKLNGLYAKEGVDPKDFGKGLAEGVMSVVEAMRELGSSPIKQAEVITHELK